MLGHREKVTEGGKGMGSHGGGKVPFPSNFPSVLSSGILPSFDFLSGDPWPREGNCCGRRQTLSQGNKGEGGAKLE